MNNRLAIPLLLMSALALVMGMTGGLQRLGWDMLPHGPALILAHGPLMICGFFASLIAIERAVALQQGWGWIAPALIVTGSIGSTIWPIQGLALLIAGTGVLAIATFTLYLRQKSLFSGLLIVAVLCLLTGDVVWWLRGTVSAATAWWMLGLVLTITAERLELTRLLPRRRHSTQLLLAVIFLLMTGAALVATRRPEVLGVALVMLGLWLLRHDIARRNLRMVELPRYIAVCLCAGYAWLIVAGVLLMTSSGLISHGVNINDAVLHAVFVGFVFSMVFGHAPIIVPAITRLQVKYTSVFYMPLLILHLSLAVRIAADISGHQPCRLAGGSVNVLAILLFIALILKSVFFCRRKDKGRRSISIGHPEHESLNQQ